MILDSKYSFENILPHGKLEYTISAGEPEPVVSINPQNNQAII
ncbi:hypothetical protein ACFLVC_01310 [Chloroflexota bacterium]